MAGCILSHTSRGVVRQTKNLASTRSLQTTWVVRQGAREKETVNRPNAHK